MKYFYMFCVITDAFFTGMDVATGNVTGWTYTRTCIMTYFAYLLLKEEK